MKRRLVAWVLVVALLVTSVIVDVPGRIFAGESAQTTAEGEITTEEGAAQEQTQAGQEAVAQVGTADSTTENEAVSEQSTVEADTVDQAVETGAEDKSTESSTASEDTMPADPEAQKTPVPKKQKPSMFKAESAEEVEEELSVETYNADLPIVNSSYKVQVEIDGVWQDVTSDMVLYAGQNVKLVFEWELDNDDRDTVQFTVDKSVFALTGLNITDSEKHDLFFNSDLVGTYQMIGDQVVIDLTKEDFIINMDTRRGGIELEGEVSNLEDKTKDGEEQKIKFGDFEATPVIYASPDASSVGVQKSAVNGVIKNGDKYQQQFEILVNAYNGKVTNIDLTDTYDANQLSNPSSVTVVMANGTTKNYASLDAAMNDIKGLTLYGGDTVRIQYTMDVNADIYKPDSPNYTNEVSGEYTSNRSDEPKKTNDSMAVVWANKPTISKAFNGADTTAGETTWTITVDMKDCYESGKNNLSDYLTSITDIPGYGLNATQKNISLSDFTSNGNGQWTYTYTVPVTDAVKGSVVDEAVKNTVEMTTKENDKYTSGEQTGTYPGQSPATIEKVYIDNEKQDDGVYVTWEITVNDLPEGITNVTVTDKPTNWDAVSGDNSQQKITSEVWVNGKQVVNKNSQIVDNNIIESWQTTSVWDSGTLIFKDSWIEANRTQPIKIRFVTLITQDTHNRKFINQATLSYEDKTTGSKKDVGPATAAFRDTSDLLTKTGEQRDASKNVITYTLQAGLAPLDLVDGQQLVLTDTLPEGLEIVPDTLSLNISGPYNDFINQWTQESVNLVANTSSNPVTFTVTVDADLRTLVERAMQDGNAGIAYLTITYDAKVKDEAAFIKEQQAVTYENTVTGTYEGDPIGGGKAVNTLTPADVVNKVSEYTQSTAPYVHYQITVNPNAVALLGGTGGKLTATDVVGDALRFVTKGDFDNANNKARYGVKIYTTDGIDLLANGQASYTRSLDRHTLSFELPDSTAIIIEYYAYAKPDSELTPENTTNQFSLEGTGNTAENHAVADAMTAYVPSGWASAETGSITLVKYWTDGGEQIALNGSVFKLVKAFVNDAGAIVEGEVVNEALRVTDKDDPDNAGAIRITGLLKNQLYALYEVEADTGMALNREPFYFVIDGSTLVSLPPNVKTFDVSGEIYLYENVRAGGLEITKTIQGNVTKEEAEGALKFKVTWDSNADGEKKNVLIGEYTLADFDYDEDADTWTLSLDNLAPGKYTVEETVYDIEGKPATSVVYSKDGGTTWSSDAVDAKDTKAEVDVEVWNEGKNNASTLEYKDTYDAAPEIHLSKKIAGSTKKLEGAELELLDAAGTQVAAWTSGAADKEFVIGTAPGEIQLSTDTEKHVYTLKETAAPEGYSIAAPVDFIVVQDASGNVKIQLYDKTAGAVLADTAKMIDNITLTLYDKKLDLNIRKVNNAATGAVALAGAEFVLKKGDEVLATVTTSAGKTVLDASKLQADNTTEYTLTETKAPAGCKALAQDIKFKVAEDGKIVLVTPAAGNIVSLEDEGITFRIVNEEYIAISGKKIWDDSNNSDGNRPESVTIALEQKQEGGDWAKVPGKVAEVKGSGASAADLIYTFDDLPKYDENGVAYEYRVVEDDVPLNYECSGGTKADKYNITNTYTAERISVSVTKVWDDNNNQDGLRTDIYVQLYKNGKPLERYQFKLSENDWTHEWDDLLKYENGQPIQYTVEEVDIAGNKVAPTGYIATVSDPVTSDSSGNETADVSDIKTIEYTITNTHTPEKTSLSVKKVWDDEEDNDGIRPDSVTVRLYADNAATGKTQVLNEANNWQAAFTDLDAYRDKGTAIKYTVVETAVANYTVSYAPKEYAYAEGAKTGTITVTNTYKPGETSYTVKKVWADGNNRDGKRPGTIKVQLCADGTPITDMSQYVTDPEATLSAVIELNAADNWTYTWDGLKAKADSTDIVYSVVELGTDGITAITDGAQVDFDADAAVDYTVTYDNGTNGVTTITNAYTPETVSLDVEKEWLNSDGTDYTSTLPARVTVRLYSQTDNNPKPVVVTGLDKVLNAANNWKAAWADLPKYADGKLITYTVKEVSVPDGWVDTYDTSV
ncbi:MAG: Cna B-type domain-containing protein, partial [Lachnospiraceae bacterium]|nr:Cna B-type domain-containing protein [Lachnospiraceae bacterium]